MGNKDDVFFVDVVCQKFQENWRALVMIGKNLLLNWN